jgi:hypothetical protein
MCTVTYLPLGGNDFVLTSNRDEKTVRKPALQPGLYCVHDRLVVFPKDQQAEGTWIATSGSAFTLCLLNGAFKAHKSTGNYAKSRGLLVLDFFKYNDVDTFLSEYSFNNIEPFTLLILNTEGTKPELTEVRWDGSLIYRKEIDASMPCIWSSTTLYSEETAKEREQWFEDFLNTHNDYKGYSILDFHHFGGKGNAATSLVMNREDKVKTVSITSILSRENTLHMTYKDVINRKTYNRRIC